jgi:hypothetical protein
VTLPKNLSTLELLAITGYRRPTLTDLEAQGVIKRAGRGTWPTIATLKAIMRHHRETMMQGAGGPKARLLEARAREIQLRVDLKLENLIPMEEAERRITLVCGRVRTELSSLPIRTTRDLALRAILEREINMSLERIAATFAEPCSATARNEDSDVSEA